MCLCHSLVFHQHKFIYHQCRDEVTTHRIPHVAAATPACLSHTQQLWIWPVPLQDVIFSWLWCLLPGIPAFQSSQGYTDCFKTATRSWIMTTFEISLCHQIEISRNLSSYFISSLFSAIVHSNVIYVPLIFRCYSHLEQLYLFISGVF